MRKRAWENGQLLTLAEIREFDMVDYLLELGFRPVKVRDMDHWYLSPFRNERTASFKVSRKLNRWYDHGLGSGGNLVDFAILLYQCTVREVIKLFSDYQSFHQPTRQSISRTRLTVQCAMQVLSTGALTSRSLIRYISSRCVFEEIANRYCQQVNYKIGDRRYFALGLRNDSGGYELRNSFSKIASSPKDITTINVGASTVSVFEGMFDFLSYKTMIAPTNGEPENHVILNSISLFERSRPFLESHDRINLFLDRDTAGSQCCSAAKRISEKYNDASGMYAGFKDLNDWLISIF